MVIPSYREFALSLIFSFMLFLFYLDIPLQVGDSRIPNFYGFLGALFGLCILKFSLSKIALIRIFYFLGICLLSSIFSQLIMGGQGRVIALLTLSFSLLFGYFLFRFYTKYNLSNSIFLSMAIFILIGSFLELNFDFVRNTSNSFGEVFHPNNYDAYLRDYELTGKIRPKFFSSEPSHMAKFFVIMMVCWYVSTSNKYKNSITYFLFFIGVLINPTGALAFSFFIIASIQLLNSFKTSKKIIYVVVGLPLFFIFTFPLINFLFSNRIENFLALEDTSMVVRLVMPASLAIDALKENIFLGIGFGGKSLLEDSYLTFISNIYTRGVEYTELFDSKFNNFFWEFIVSFGLLFAPIALIALNKLVQVLGCTKNQAFTIFIIMIIMSNTFGGITLPRFWVYLFLLIGAFTYKNKNLNLQGHKY